MLAKIQAYERHLAQVPAAFLPPCCPVCLEAGGLCKHEFRPRSFWVGVANEVRKVPSFVLRVACKVCCARTTVLPDFALRHKRYVLAEVVDCSDRYLLDDTATYESAARIDGRPVFHDTEGRARARSTVHRWIGFLGSLALLLAGATDLLREADPAFSSLAEMRPISPLRYRSEARRERLERAHRLLRVRDRLHQKLRVETFPSIATPGAWR